MTRLLPLALLLAPLTAHAGTVTCGPHDLLIKGLAEKYQERLIERRRSPAGRVVEIWQEPTGKTWSVVVQQQGNIACLARAGKGWAVDALGVRV